MKNYDQELKRDIRSITGYGSTELPSQDLHSALDTAERHIRARKSGLDDQDDLLATKAGEEALFWYACLFAKVQTGELDSKDVQIGAIDESSLLANNDGEETEWFRRARLAMRNFRADSQFVVASPDRGDRDYDSDWPVRDEDDAGIGVGGGIGGPL